MGRESVISGDLRAAQSIDEERLSDAATRILAFDLEEDPVAG
jgi:hypothetical protein